MDKKLFVVAIAVGTVVLTTVLQVFMQKDEMNAKTKRLLWMTLIAGVVALIALGTVLLKG